MAASLVRLRAFYQISLQGYVRRDLSGVKVGRARLYRKGWVWWREKPKDKKGKEMGIGEQK